jgi:hypothetical protein
MDDRVPVCKKGPMAQHEIDVKVPQDIWVENTDLEIKVKADGRLLGRVHISRGTIDWIPSKAQSRYRLGWERFGEVMVGYGRKRTLPAHAQTSVRRRRAASTNRKRAR